IEVPYELTFDVDHGMILDGSGTGTGFTHIDQPSKGQGYIPGNLHVDTTAGAFSIQTTKGLSTTSSNSLDNALSVGIDAPSQVTQLRTTILNPPGGTGAFEQGGLWFGNDEDNYVKMVILSTGAEQVIEYYIEIGGSQAGMKRSLPLALQPARVQLTLRADPSNRAIQASYSLDGGTEVILGAFTAPGEFFSFDAAGIDPLIGTRSFGGIF